MGRMVKCAFCDQLVDKDVAARYNSKNYHANCAEKQKDKDELLDYVCKLFGLKRPGPAIYSQLKNFMAKNSYYTFKGILNALTYFYEVKKNSTKNSKQGIGIVPYVYDEASEYYANISYKQHKIAKSVEKQLVTSPKEIHVKKETNSKKRKTLYELE